jgi:excisionase family DNA binding protein
MERDLLSSREAATILGVSASSVKRWADEGMLPCVKTAGQHRRFARDAVERFRGALGATSTNAIEASSWIALLAGGESRVVEGELLAARARRGSWARVADELGAVLDTIGDRWAAGELAILDEHIMSERLSRALARVAEWTPVAHDAPRALLGVPDGEEHTLGLSLAEVCLRELGWATLWAGRRMPIDEVARALSGPSPVRMVAVSASLSSDDAQRLGRTAATLAKLCEKAGARLILGGRGAWPERTRGASRLHQFRELAEVARTSDGS